MSLALSRTQDDKGNDRWTLFGVQPRRRGRRDLARRDRGQPRRARALLRRWFALGHDRRAASAKFDDPRWHRHDRHVRAVREAAGVRAQGVPRERTSRSCRRRRASCSSSTRGYRELATHAAARDADPAAAHLPARRESCPIRIPQSGWLDEGEHAHHVKTHISRTHRWQRVERDGDGQLRRQGLGRAVLDRRRRDRSLRQAARAQLRRSGRTTTRSCSMVRAADRAAIETAGKIVDVGGRFGYRMYCPPMRAGAREVFWHVPLVATATGRLRGMPGMMTAELADPQHHARAEAARAPGARRRGGAADRARAAQAPGEPQRAQDARRARAGRPAVAGVRALAAAHPQARDARRVARQATPTCARASARADEPGAPLVLDHLGTRAFEEAIWRSIAGLAEGEFRQKSIADGIATNRGQATAVRRRRRRTCTCTSSATSTRSPTTCTARYRALSRDA